MEQELVKATVNELKRSFRQYMNGVAARSMSERGVQYKINWGVSVVNLMDMANQYPHDLNLAIALWKENIRECKILALMLAPTDDVPEELSELWMAETSSQELACLGASLLYSRLPYAPRLAYRWIASASEYAQMAGFHVLSRLFQNGQEPNERGINEYLDQAAVCLQSTHLGVRRAVINSLSRFSELGDEYALVLKKAAKSFAVPVHFYTFAEANHEEQE